MSEQQNPTLAGVLNELRQPLLDLLHSYKDFFRRRKRHEVRLVVIREMTRARYDHSHHTSAVIQQNVATANAYALAMYPESEK